MKTVAFICTHNSCRSQIAEALGKRFAADTFICYSAGTEIKSEINPDAVRLVKDMYGIDMNNQKPKKLDKLSPVDIVITMGCGVQCPYLPCEHREDWGLEDPTGKDDDTFKAAIHEIEKRILSLRASLSTNPYLILKDMMKSATMHGPVHHYLDGAAFLTALYNYGLSLNLNEALAELKSRSEQMPGATCGKWGVCGSAASLGAALAILHGTGPLSDNDFYKDNLRLTSRILAKEAELGGPRCCKRNGFTAIETAVDFVKERYGIELEKSRIKCEFSAQNPTCLKERCPYFS